MREILFRGKTFGGKWVYGYYSDCCYGKFPCKPSIIEVDEWKWEPVMVIPESVGQYIGVNDRNGKKIFEGDILLEKFSHTKNVYIILREFSSFCYSKYPNGKFAMPIDDGECGINSLLCEVIGNIHDNHELMEGRHDEL